MSRRIGISTTGVEPWIMRAQMSRWQQLGRPGDLRASYCIGHLRPVTRETHVVCMRIPVATWVLVSWRGATGSLHECCSCFWDCCVFKWMLVGHCFVFSVCIDLCGWPCVYIYAYIHIHIYIKVKHIGRHPSGKCTQFYHWLYLGTWNCSSLSHIGLLDLTTSNRP